MKNVLIISSDLYKQKSTDFLIKGYIDGLLEVGVPYRILYIADLFFNPNRRLPSKEIKPLESDLLRSLKLIHWSTHIVVFCPVYTSFIPSKIRTFFDILFNSNQLQFDPNRIDTNYFGKSARIVNILDKELLDVYNTTKSTNFMSIRRETFERCSVRPVRTSTVGRLYELHNPYSQKWYHKMKQFGIKTM
ncbi:NAD(P)H-dependent oxidoreductase [Sphingobacterium bovistauri]|uniref:NAD(P)H-dependent oxidoreductase n=1 Tax=Sphingobacterium bovistauri TaxID=2781959 RepID=A0ABS7Z7R6_9SPHI|nr:NAD(P)H-dependent oxidoreductase [Sphingobacterium bovistauri]MCA5006232.1 NAD(P)H-dependent oxidoreductase [Sphingobacterium bovistauri]